MPHVQRIVLDGPERRRLPAPTPPARSSCSRSVICPDRLGPALGPPPRSRSPCGPGCSLRCTLPCAAAKSRVPRAALAAGDREGAARSADPRRDQPARADRVRNLLVRDGRDADSGRLRESRSTPRPTGATTARSSRSGPRAATSSRRAWQAAGLRRGGGRRAVGWASLTRAARSAGSRVLDRAFLDRPWGRADALRAREVMRPRARRRAARVGGGAERACFYERIGGSYIRDSEVTEWGRVLEVLGVDLR